MRVNKWANELKLLSKIATFYPKAAYRAFTSSSKKLF